MLPLLVVLLSLPLAAESANSLTPAEKADGWTLLFDGQSMSAWRFDFPAVASVWGVSDGWLCTTPKGHIGHDLLSREEFHNFELQFEWKTAKASNSGVKYRLQGHVNWIPRGEDKAETAYVEREYRKKKLVNTLGFEFQVADDDVNKDAQRGAKWESGALYDLIPAKKSKRAGADAIHKGRIVLRGMHFEHWLDGEKVTEGDLNNPALFSGSHDPKRSEIVEGLKAHREQTTPVALQYHGDPVSFRAIKIRRLPD